LTGRFIESVSENKQVNASIEPQVSDDSFRTLLQQQCGRYTSSTQCTNLLIRVGACVLTELEGAFGEKHKQQISER